MARALFFSLPLHGHINPSLPLVSELVAQGDEIIFYAAAPFAAKIEQQARNTGPIEMPFYQR